MEVIWDSLIYINYFFPVAAKSLEHNYLLSCLDLTI